MIRKSALAAGVLIALIAGAAGAGRGGGLAAAVDKALDRSCVNKSRTAVRVVALPSGAPVYDRNGSLSLTPASVQKLFVTAAALHHLGPAYRFKTEILHTGAMADGVIQGDLIVRGGGDPKLVPELVWLIAERVRLLGLTRVKGDLVIDESFFDRRRMAPSWSRNHTQRAYDARLGALSVNFNTVAVSVRPGVKEGEPLVVGVMPDSPYVTLINRGATAARGKGGVKARRSEKHGRLMVTVTGVMKPDAEEKTIYLNVPDPGRYAAETFREFFSRAGIVFDGGIRRAAAPEDAIALYVHESAPLAVILRDMSKYSNNFMAEQVAKTMAAELLDAPGSHEGAIAIIRAFLTSSGVDTKGVVLADASGLSRKNRLTARAVTDLLTVMNRRFDIGPDFLAALGIMGVDGSVEKRLEGSPAKAQARAKTGSLARLSSLAGYVASRRGSLYAFAIFLNDTDCYYKDADRIEDKIVSAIHLLGGAP